MWSSVNCELFTDISHLTDDAHNQASYKLYIKLASYVVKFICRKNLTQETSQILQILLK